MRDESRAIRPPQVRPHQVETSFIEIDGSRRYCTLWRPTTGNPIEVLVLAPPFGDEMNKSRRTLSSAARTFAARGTAVLCMDLFGCGDSEGDFREATWSRWCDDLRIAAHRARDLMNVPVALWAVRAGALFAPDLQEHFDRTILWQPVIQGESYVTQVLRIKVAADGFLGLSTTTKSLRLQLEQGDSLEIGGYEWRPDLLLAMARRSLNHWTPPGGEVLWLETGAETSGSCTPAASQIAQRLREGGLEVRTEWIRGEPFWMTLDIAENRALADRTAAALRQD
ncbi:MAG: hydrolase 2, exosortase A system-associated [Burkholderiales bacterium]